MIRGLVRNLVGASSCDQWSSTMDDIVSLCKGMHGSIVPPCTIELLFTFFCSNQPCQKMCNSRKKINIQFWWLIFNLICESNNAALTLKWKSFEKVLSTFCIFWKWNLKCPFIFYLKDEQSWRRKCIWEDLLSNRFVSEIMQLHSEN